jgi:hypothetical protein
MCELQGRRIEASGLLALMLPVDARRWVLADNNDTMHERSEDLESKLTKVCASTIKNVAALEERIKSAEAHVVDVDSIGEKRFGDFEKEFLKDLAELCTFYECNVQSIGSLFSPMPEGEPSVADYIRWLSIEVTCLPEVFAGINENFISTMLDGTLVMARGSVNLAALQASATDSSADILLAERDV